MFYNEAGDAHLEAAVRRFEELEQLIRPTELQDWASRFSEQRFRANMLEVIENKKQEAVQIAAPAPAIFGGFA